MNANYWTILILSIIVFSGCLNPSDTITGFAKQLPEVKAFLQENPNANIRSVIWDANDVQTNQDFIFEKCGKQLPEQKYYYIAIEDQQNKIFVWINEKQEVQCIVREGTETSQPISEIGSEKKECIEDIDCNDGLASTHDTCPENKCKHKKIIKCQNNDGFCAMGCSYASDNDCGIECNNASECNDGNPSTQDNCNPATHACEYTETEQRSDQNNQGNQNTTQPNDGNTIINNKPKTCGNLGGYNCTETQSCAGTWLTAIDTTKCCNILCTNTVTPTSSDQNRSSTDTNTSTSTTNPNTLTITSTPQATNNTNNSTVISWTTNQPARGKVKYSTNYSPASSGTEVLGSCCLTQHGILLTGLTAYTIYYYVVYSTDQAGNEIGGTGIYNFITSHAVTITNIQDSNITSSTANITWKTNVETVGEIHYNYGSSLATSAPETIYSFDHNIQLTGLNPATTHNYTIYAYTRDVNIRTEDTAAKSSQSSFTTLGNLPIISNAQLKLDGTRGMYVSWLTDVVADAKVRMNTDQTQLGSGSDLVFYNPNYWQDHKILLNALVPNTTYYYTISSTNSNGTTTTPVASYTPPATVTVSNISYTFGTSSGVPIVTFSWTTDKPTYNAVSTSDSDPTLQVSTTGNYGGSNTVYTTSHSFTTGFSGGAGKTYYYKITAYNLDGYYGESPIATFTIPN